MAASEDGVTWNSFLHSSPKTNFYLDTVAKR